MRCQGMGAYAFDQWSAVDAALVRPVGRELRAARIFMVHLPDDEYTNIMPRLLAAGVTWEHLRVKAYPVAALKKSI